MVWKEVESVRRVQEAMSIVDPPYRVDPRAYLMNDGGKRVMCLLGVKSQMCADVFNRRIPQDQRSRVPLPKGAAA